MQVVMYKTNNEIARAIWKGKEQNDVYGIVHYPLRKSWLLLFFSACIMNWLLLLVSGVWRQPTGPCPVARVWTILFIKCLWKGLVVLAFCGRHNDRWSHQIKCILLKVFSYFLLSATCCHLQSGSKEVSWRLLTLSLQDKNFNKRNGLMFFVQMSRPLYRSAAALLSEFLLWEFLTNIIISDPAHNVLPRGVQGGVDVSWGDLHAPREHRLQDLPGARGDRRHKEVCRCRLIKQFYCHILFSFLSFIANFGRKQLSFTFLNFLQITRHLRPW